MTDTAIAMLSRRSVVHAALAAPSAPWLLHATAARADQAFQRFLPLFVDLDGWQGNKPDGMSMEMSNTSMTTAKRDYTRASPLAKKFDWKAFQAAAK